jgi:hypothetical protein
MVIPELSQEWTKVHFQAVSLLSPQPLLSHLEGGKAAQPSCCAWEMLMEWRRRHSEEGWVLGAQSSDLNPLYLGLDCKEDFHNLLWCLYLFTEGRWFCLEEIPPPPIPLHPPFLSPSFLFRLLPSGTIMEH